MSDYSSSIGIVGGGIAGLIAGCTLQEQGGRPQAKRVGRSDSSVWADAKKSP